MAEQENETIDLTVGEVNDLADSVLPRMNHRTGVYIVEEEFTHKRKQTVGSLFRPRRYPRLRPLKLRELIAGGLIRPATPDELEELKAAKPVTRINPSSYRYVDPVEEADEESVAPAVKNVGGGWYEVSFKGEVRKVQGEAVANELVAELMEGSDG
jgi:hypothetical protein